MDKYIAVIVMFFLITVIIYMYNKEEISVGQYEEVYNLVKDRSTDSHIKIMVKAALQDSILSSQEYRYIIKEAETQATTRERHILIKELQ